VGNPLIPRLRLRMYGRRRTRRNGACLSRVVRFLAAIRRLLVGCDTTWMEFRMKHRVSTEQLIAFISREPDDELSCLIAKDLLDIRTDLKHWERVLHGVDVFIKSEEKNDRTSKT